jgi:hypothetical protein
VRNQARKERITVGMRPGRLHIFGILVALGVLVAGAATFVSRQSAAVKGSKQQETISVVSRKPNKTYVTVKVAGQDVQIDPQTGDIQPLTPQEAEKLAAGLKPMLNRSTEGLTPMQHADGSKTVDLQGRFRNVTVARVNKDGSVTQSCVDNPRAAGAFFGIDPKLIESAPDQPRIKPNQN